MCTKLGSLPCYLSQLVSKEKRQSINEMDIDARSSMSDLLAPTQAMAQI